MQATQSNPTLYLVTHHPQAEVTTLKHQYQSDMAEARQHLQQTLERDRSDAQAAMGALEAAKTASEVGRVP